MTYIIMTCKFKPSFKNETDTFIIEKCTLPKHPYFNTTMLSIVIVFYFVSINNHLSQHSHRQLM